MVQDDEHDAEKAINAYNTVMDEGAQFILGTVTTSPCIAVAAQAYEERVFMLTPSASSTEVTEGKDNVYQVCFTDPAQGTASAEMHRGQGPGPARSPSSTTAATPTPPASISAFEAKATELGLEVVAAEAFASDDNADFSVQLSACQERRR